MNVKHSVTSADASRHCQPSEISGSGVREVGEYCRASTNPCSAQAGRRIQRSLEINGLGIDSELTQEDAACAFSPSHVLDEQIVTGNATDKSSTWLDDPPRM